MHSGIVAVTRFAWGYWQKRPMAMTMLGIGIGLATLAELGIPMAVRGLTDAIAGERPDPSAAFMWLIAFSGLGVLFHVSHKGGDYLWCHVQCRIMRQIGADSFARVQHYSSDWHADTFAGKTVRNISRGIWEFDRFGDALYFQLVPTACVTLGVLLVLLWQWPLIGVGFLAGALIYVSVSIWLNVRYVSPLRQQAVATDSTVAGAIADAISCNAAVKAAAAEHREERRLGQMFDLWQRQMRRSWFGSIHTSVVQSGILIVLQFSMVATALWFWSRGQATPGDVTFMLFVNFIVRSYLRDIGQNIRDLQQAVNDLEPVVRYLATRPEIEDRWDAIPLNVSRGAVQFEHVRFGYRKAASWLFDDLALDIQPGERVALVGRSGSGKSTLVKLLQHLHRLDGGRIRIDNQDIADATLVSLRRAIALVPQDPVLFHRSLAENIAYSRPDASIAQIQEAARRAHAAEFIEALKDGYETLVGERGVKLSGGERQRVAIARAILADAPILILDEATSALDSVSENLIQSALKELMFGRTSIIIAHRLSTIRAVDRILVFESGRIVEQGQHQDLMEANGVYASLYQAQLGGYLNKAA